MGREADAIKVLQRQAPPHNAPDAERGEHFMILSEALRRSGRAADFDEAILSARAYTWSSRDRELHGELAFYEALRSWGERELESARGYLDEAMPRMGEVGKARISELLGLIASSAGDYDGQILHLRDALRSMDAAREPDVWVEASLLYNLAALVPDIEMPDVMALVQRRAETLAWTQDTKRSQFQVLRCLGWAAALSGDHLLAVRRFRESADIAPTPALSLLGSVDRAYLAREMRLEGLASEALATAERIVNAVQWNQISGEERIALLKYAELRAADDADHASMLVERYRSIKGRVSSLFSASSDRRFSADEQYSYGIVAAACGRRATAVRSLNDAFEIWSSIGFTWRAVRAAAALFELTHDSKYRSYARAGVTPFASSWLERRVVALAA